LLDSEGAGFLLPFALRWRRGDDAWSGSFCDGWFGDDNLVKKHRNKVLAAFQRLGKAPVETLLGLGPKENRQFFAHPPEIEDRVEIHVSGCHRHKYSASVS
jgi:hypothetical protein